MKKMKEGRSVTKKGFLDTDQETKSLKVDHPPLKRKVRNKRKLAPYETRSALWRKGIIPPLERIYWQPDHQERRGVRCEGIVQEKCAAYGVRKLLLKGRKSRIRQ